MVQLEDPRLTKVLNDHGAAYKAEHIKIAQIDKEKSLHNQARIGEVLNDETVLMYGCAMEGGAVFPPIIVYPDGNKPVKYIVIDGNHRVGAAEASDKDTIDALIVTNGSPTMIQTLTYELNTLNGLPTTMKERIQQALHMVSTGATMREAARALSIPENRLQNAVHQQEADMRLYKIRRSAPGELAPSTRRTLGRIRSDRVLARALELVTQARMSQPETEALVVAVNKERNEDDQLVAVAREVNRQSAKVAATAGGKISMPESLRRLNSAIAAIDRVDPKKVHEDFANAGDSMKMLMMSKVADASKRLREIMQ